MIYSLHELFHFALRTGDFSRVRGILFPIPLRQEIERFFIRPGQFLSRWQALGFGFQNASRERRQIQALTFGSR